MAEDKFRLTALKWHCEDEARGENVKLLAENGLIGMCTPKAHGGLSASFSLARALNHPESAQLVRQHDDAHFREVTQ